MRKQYKFKENMPVEGHTASEFGCEFVVITYNIHSAMSDERLAAILEELEDTYWDVLVLVETIVCFWLISNSLVLVDFCCFRLRFLFLADYGEQ